MQILTKKLIFKSKILNNDLEIEGYASVFDFEDEHKDIIKKGAFNRSIKSKNNIKFLWQHDEQSPIGKISEITEDDNGLFVKAIITSGTDKGREAIDLIQKGIVDSLSIGFISKKDFKKGNCRIIEEADLWEVSLVTFPANPMSLLSKIGNKNLSNNQNQYKIKSSNMENTEINNFETISFSEKMESKSRSLNRARLNDMEFKAFSEESEDEGSGFARTELYERVIENLKISSPLRKLASMTTISSNVLELLIQNGEFDSGWVAEKAERPVTANSKIKNKQIHVHEIYSQPKATQRLLSDACINIEEWITSQIVDSFSKAENEAFISGDGVNKPKGILTCDDIEKVKVEEAGKIGFEDIINLINSLDEVYQSNASFLMNRRTMALIQTIKDSDGRFIWQSSIAEGAPNKLFGIPVYCSNEMPTPGEGELAILYGDFNRGYKIVDRQGMSLMRDPFTEKPFVKFYATKRVGGDVVDANALKILKL